MQNIANKSEAKRCVHIVNKKLSKGRVNWIKVEKLLNKSIRLYSTFEAQQLLANLPKIKALKEANKPKYDPSLQLASHEIIISAFIRINYINYNLFPQSLINLCIMYYQWDEFQIINNNDIANKSDKQTVYIGDNIINFITIYGASFISCSNRIYEWKIKCILKNNIPDRIIGNCFGIASTTEAEERSIIKGYIHPIEYYYIFNGHGRIYKGIGGCDYRGYGTTFTSNDIITIILDLNNKTIAFKKNKINYGIAFTKIYCDVDVEYRLAVSFDASCIQSIQIVDYRFYVSDIDKK